MDITPRDIERFISALERIASALEEANRRPESGKIYQQYLDYVRQNVEERNGDAEER